MCVLRHHVAQTPQSLELVEAKHGSLEGKMDLTHAGILGVIVGLLWSICDTLRDILKELREQSLLK